MFGFIKNAIKQVADQVADAFNDIIHGEVNGNEIEWEADSEEEVEDILEDIGAEEDFSGDDGGGGGMTYFTHRCRYEYQISNHYHGGGNNKSCDLCLDFDKTYSDNSPVEITYTKWENGDTEWAGEGDEHLLNSWFEQMDDTQKQYILSNAENREDIKVDTHRAIAPYMIDDENGAGECKCWLKFISHRTDGITDWEGK